ncbi:MAG: hypothetical protein AAFZ07_04210 [Actinomycetota bacterium]
MPDMPLPTSRPVGLLALEAAIGRLVSTPAGRRALGTTASSWDETAFAASATAAEAVQTGLFAHLAAEIEPIRDALVAMARSDTNGRVPRQAAGSKDRGRIEAVLLEAGLRHMDWEWLSPQNRSGFWKRWIGDPAPILRSAFRIIAAYDNPESVHLVWVCGSPTFEVSISETHGRDLCIVLSTPGPDLPLVHLSDVEPGDQEPTDATRDESHLVLYGPGIVSDAGVEQRGHLVARPAAEAPDALRPRVRERIEETNARLLAALERSGAD